MRNIILLYTDGTMEEISLLRVFQNNIFYHTQVKTIDWALVPLHDNGRAYIPIKPELLYEFERADIDILHNTVQWIDYDDVIDVFDDIYTTKSVDNIIDFINYIFQSYRFLMYNDTYNLAYIETYILTFTYIKSLSINIYNKHDELIYTIDQLFESLYVPASGDSSEMINDVKDRLSWLNDFIFLHEYNLPTFIFNNAFNYRKMTGRVYDLSENTTICYYVSSAGIYYVISKKDFVARLRRSKRLQVMYLATDGDGAPEIDVAKKISKYELSIADRIDIMISVLDSGSYYAVNLEIINIEDEILFEVYGIAIMYYHHYLYHNDALVTLFTISTVNLPHTMYNYDPKIDTLLYNQFANGEIYTMDTHTPLPLNDTSISRYLYHNLEYNQFD